MPPSTIPAEPERPPLRGGVLRGAAWRALEEPDWTADFPVPAHGPPPTTTTPTATAAAPDVEALRAAWAREAAAEREAAVAAAREEGFAAGQAAGLAEVRAEMEALREAHRREAAALAERLAALWREGLALLEPLLVGLAVEVAEAALDGPLTEEARAASEAALAAAVEQLALRPPLVVALHPVDHLRLQEGGFAAAIAAAHPGLRWVPDPRLAEGDWAVDAQGAAIRHVRAETLRLLRERLGLGPAPEAPPDDDPEIDDLVERLGWRT